MKTILKISVVLLLCGSWLAGRTQFVTDFRRVADTYFLHKDYYAASEFYFRALNLLPAATEPVIPNSLKEEKEKLRASGNYEYLVFQLAESHRLYRNFIEAEKWYVIARGFSSPKYQSAGLHYAQCLRANQKYPEAIRELDSFLAKPAITAEERKTGEFELACCRLAIVEMKYPRLDIISKLPPGVNSPGSNYAMVMGADGAYFTSSRPVQVPEKKALLVKDDDSDTKILSKSTPFRNALYYVKHAGTGPDVEEVGIRLAKDYEAAAVSFSPDGSRLFFTAWPSSRKSGCMIYTSKRQSGSWSEPEMLGSQVNTAGFNAMQPMMSADGKYFLFSSDRPGGYGKYDLWYCPVFADGQLGPAVNLGPGINTDGDEQAPWYGNGRLVFSSNGKVGLGGMDFFEVRGNFRSWEEPQNMGFPFNSSKDDLYFYPADESGNKAFISSDRESVCCLEVFTATRSVLRIGGKLIDCATGKPLAGAKVTFTDLVTNMQGDTVLGAAGSYEFSLDRRKPFRITASRNDYFSKVLSYTTDQVLSVDTMLNAELCLQPYKKDVPITLENIFYEFDSANLTDTSKLVLDQLVKIMKDNPAIEVELSAHTDNKGTDDYNQELSQRRAQSCVDYLMSQGVAGTRMIAKGYGEARPVAPNTFKNGNDNPDGRQKNRRTEFKVMKD
jgi:OmpA-OmpF porin, OOP family